MTAGDDMMTTATGEAGVAVVVPDGIVGREAGGSVRKATMHLEEHIDFSTLGWVKPQIDELLSEARQALEAYAEDPEDAHLMQSCVVLLPLLNEMREARGAESVDQRVLFHPDIDRPLPPDAAGARVAFPFADLRQRTTRIRSRFQVQLLAWTQGEQPNFAEMRDCVDELNSSTQSR